MTTKNDLIGQTFNRLTVIADSGRRQINGNVLWKCVCVCGGLSYVPGNKLRSGHTKSCGCLHDELSLARLPKAWEARRAGEKKHHARSKP